MIGLLLKPSGTLFKKTRRRNMVNHTSLRQHRIQQAMAAERLAQNKPLSKSHPLNPQLLPVQRLLLLDNILIDL
jgi:hypothetical protein